MKYLSFIIGLLMPFVVVSQKEQEIATKYESFLHFEFTSPDSAFLELKEGLKEALQENNDSLIALGYKYKSWYFQDIDEYMVALSFTDSSLHYLEKSNNTKEKVNLYNQKGNLLSDMALLDSSLYWYKKGFDLAKESGDEQGVAKLANNMALAYTDKGDFIEAIEYYHLSIEKSKKVNDLQSVGDAYNNLGSLFTQIEDFQQGLEYHWKAYDIRKELDDKKKLSSVILNIGRIYMAQEKMDSARQLFFTSLQYDLTLNDQSGVALNYNNIGITYLKEGLLDSAYHFFLASYDIRKNINDPFGLIMTYNNIGEYYIIQGAYKKAISKCHLAYDIAEKNELPYEKLLACECLYKAYEKTNNLSKAYRYLKESMQLTEQLQSEEQQKDLIKKELGFVYQYKALEDSIKQAKILNEKEFKIKEAQIEKEKVEEAKMNQLLLFIVVGLFLILIGTLIFIQLRRQRKQNEIIHSKNEFIKTQKHEIDQSINYAQKIQETSLPTKDLESLFSNSFLIYLPRDGVSGDFYWLEENNNRCFVSVADCTGHGIPGAFISMIGTILMNEIYNSKKLKQPGKFLDELNRLIQLTLTSSTGSQMKDGMDISFCNIDKNTEILEYAGANNPLWVVSKNTTLNVDGVNTDPNISNSFNLFEVKADKQPIGKYMDNQASFTNHKVQLSKGDKVYLFSDGFADQFGGSKGKKFKYKPFKKLLVETSTLSASEQRLRLEESFHTWKGEYDQVDDICIIGFTI